MTAPIMSRLGSALASGYEASLANARGKIRAAEKADAMPAKVEIPNTPEQDAELDRLAAERDELEVILGM